MKRHFCFQMSSSRLMNCMINRLMVTDSLFVHSKCMVMRGCDRQIWMNLKRYTKMRTNKHAGMRYMHCGEHGNSLRQGYLKPVTKSV